MNKVLKTILAILLILVVLVLVIAAILPKQIHVERSVMIDSHAMCPFNQVNDLSLWENWSPFDDEDASMVSTYEGPRSGVGAVSRWQSEKQGNGAMIIVESVPFSKVVTELTFGDEGPSLGYFEFEDVDGMTKVTWGWDDEASYPVERIMYAIFKGMMEDSFEKGLQNIKAHCEEIDVDEDPGMAPMHIIHKTAPDQNAETAPHLYILYINERDVAYIPDAGPWTEIEAKMDKNFTELMAFVNEHGIEDYGNAFTIWHEWNEEEMTATFDCGIPVKELVEPGGNVLLKKVGPLKVVAGIHYGSYDNTAYMYDAIGAFIAANGMVMAGGPIASYIIDPSQEPDTAKWETVIMWPVF